MRLHGLTRKLYETIGDYRCTCMAGNQKFPSLSALALLLLLLP